MPKRPPKRWWNEKFQQAKRDLRKAHPDWSQETLSERARRTVGNIWFNEMTQGQRDYRTRKTERKKISDKPSEEGGHRTPPAGYPKSRN